MNSITNGLLIYVLLTTSYVSSLDEKSSNALNKCNSTAVVKASKYVNECLQLTFANKEEQSAVVHNPYLYLCSGIDETLNRICQLNKNHSLTQKAFEIEMQNLKPVTQSHVVFCSAMHDVLNNPSYVKAMNSTATATVSKVNELLNSPACNLICSDLSNKSSSPSYPLCNVFLWASRVLVDIATTKDKSKTDASQTVQKITDDPSKGIKKSDPPDATKSALPKGGSAKAQNVAESHADAPGNIPVKPSETKETKGGPATLAVQTSPAQSKQRSEKKVGEMKSAGISVSQGENISIDETDGEMETPPIDQAPRESEKDEASVVENEKLADKIKPVVTEGVKQAAPRYEDPRNEDEDIQLGSNDDMESHVNEPEIDPNLSEDTASSAIGKEDVAGDGRDKATDQKSIVPQENISAYPGPPDPPQHFFAYFMAVSFVCLVCYVGYHKKHKIMAIIFEGRKSRGGRGRRRPNTAGYRKLDCNLEEAVTSQCNSNVTHVIY